MGGENPKKEKAKLRKGLTIVITTPGRLLYHLKNTESIGFSRLQTIIIDEADRMLDMGFEREMTACLDEIKKRCVGTNKFTKEEGKFFSDEIRVQFVSATLNRKVESLGAKLMQNYEVVGFNNDTNSPINLANQTGE